MSQEKNLKAALAAVKKGWLVWPAKWDVENGRHIGLVRWSTESSNDPKQVEFWSAQYPNAHFCLNLGESNLAVLDIDNKNGKEGGKSLSFLQDEYGELPDTFKVSTPSGGLHYYFLDPKKEMRNSAGKLAEGIDTRGQGGMVPVPGAVVKGKGEYPALAEEYPLAKCPEWIPELVGSGRAKAEERDNPAVEWDLPVNVTRATRYLVKSAPLAEEGERDDLTYRVACKVRDLGVTEDTCVNLILSWWIPRHEEEGANLGDWGPEDVRRAVGSAYRYAVNQPGSETPEALFVDDDDIDAQLAAYEKNKADADESEDDDDWPFLLSDLQGEPPERRWILRDWLPEGEILFLTGEGGTGKTLLALQLAMSVSMGVPFLGVPVERKVPCLLVLCEDDKDEIHRRKAAIMESAEYGFEDEEDEDVWIWPRVGKPSVIAHVDGYRLKTDKFFKKIKMMLKKMGDGPKFLVLDTISDIFSGDENNRSAVNQFAKRVLGAFQTQHNCTVAVLGHPPKNGAEYSGSTAWNNSFRARLFLKRHESEQYPDHRILVRAKANYASIGAELTFFWERGSFKVVDPDFEDEAEILLEQYVMEAITEACRMDEPLSLAAQSSRYIGTKVTIKGANGKELSKDEKVKTVNSLLTSGKVENVKGYKGDSRGKNGLWPVSDYDPEDFR